MTDAALRTRDSSHAGPHPDAPLPAACLETHIGVVFLVGGRAYKLKKPVRTGFLDFTSRTARLRACQREVALNRRLAPDVYLGVADVTDPVSGVLDDHLVVMRRMPDDRRLASLVSAGADVVDPLRALARQLAAFHSRADRGPHINAEGTSLAQRRRWTHLLDGLSRFDGSVLSNGTLSTVERLAVRFVDGRRPLFDARCAEDRIVDGHGDLIADDVFCLPDGPRALDCLEFDDRLRYVDGLDDAAFLAMDLERLGHPELGQQFLDDYAESAADPAPTSLRHHYVAYRSWVRTLVACLRAEQGDPIAGERARLHSELTLRHLTRGAVRLVLVGGLPGTGKSTLARSLADKTSAVLLSSDPTRRAQAQQPPDANVAARYRQGPYAPASTQRVYDELLRRAQAALTRGEHVVLDASWTDARYRGQAEELAENTASELVQLRCDAPPEVAAERILRRRPGPSDATPAVATAMAADADPWPKATTIRTTTTPHESLAEALRCWGDATTVRSPR